MSDTIQVDYDQVRQITQQLRTEQQDLQKMLGQVESQVSILKSGKWVAESATKFYNTMDNELTPRLRKMIRAIQDAAETMDETAKNINAADEQNQEFFPN